MKVNNICCIGAGYVGGPTMSVIAQQCPKIKVTVVDKNPARIEAWNEADLDLLPVYEPGLQFVIAETRGKNLFFSNDIDAAIRSADMIFMAVNTPTITEGEGKGMAADLTFVEQCAHKIAEVAEKDTIVIEKSTLPVRTAEKIKSILDKNIRGLHFEVLSNPEFLAEGTAIADLYKSDRVLIGCSDTEEGEAAAASLISIYKQWIPEKKILKTNVWSAELSKLASNAMLAQRISSINSLSALCERTEASIDEVAQAIGMDHRIGSHFLKASVGFGGSCFQKDILNLVYLCQYYGLTEVAEYWHQVVKINDYQKNRFAKKIIAALNGTVAQKKICLLGWAFKKDTNDSRESAAIYIACQLIKQGGEIQVYDPMVSEDKIHDDLRLLWESENIGSAKIDEYLLHCIVHNSHISAMKGANVVAILTEWEEFKCYNWSSLANSMTHPATLLDGRNILPVIKHPTLQQYTLGNA